MSPAAYPWQHTAWAQLQQVRAAGRLAHALLLAGPAGVGKRAFAQELSRALVCSANPAEAPCGRCAPCRQHAAGTYPDAVVVAPPEPGKSIPVDDVRTLTDRLGLSGQGTKVALIDTAEVMTASAANSLLKTLEEPPGDAVLLLVSDRPGRIPATVRSRCQRVDLALPPAAQARQWLAEQGVGDPGHWLARARGAPLHAHALATGEAEVLDDGAAEALLATLEQGRVPVGVAREGDRSVLAARVSALCATVEDLIRVALTQSTDGLRQPEQRERIAALAPRMDARKLFHYLDSLYRSSPTAGDSLRPETQYQGLLADAAAIARSSEH